MRRAMGEWCCYAMVRRPRSCGVKDVRAESRGESKGVSTASRESLPPDSAREQAGGCGGAGDGRGRGRREQQVKRRERLVVLGEDWQSKGPGSVSAPNAA